MLDFMLINSVVKISTYNHKNENLDNFTGFFYNPFNSLSSKKFIVTARHGMFNDAISYLNIKYYDSSMKKNTYLILQLNEYKTISIDGSDITIISFESNIFNYYINNKYIDNNINNYLGFKVAIPGYYMNEQEQPIVDFGEVVSIPHSYKEFYIKSSLITNGYSGAPVFVLYNDSNNMTTIKLLGMVSKKLKRYIISINPSTLISQDYNKIMRLSQ